jgi:hypothetical protein
MKLPVEYACEYGGYELTLPYFEWADDEVIDKEINF